MRAMREDALIAERRNRVLTDVAGLYLSDKAGEVRQATYNSYHSTIGIFTGWLRRQLPDCRCGEFGRIHALEFMQWLREKRHVSNRTYNNYLKQLRVLFSWCVEQMYCSDNPFAGVKARRREPKRRELIGQLDRARIRTWLLLNNRELLLFAELVYFALMRPAEIRRIRLSQIHLSEHYILIPASQAKCGIERCAPLSDELCTLISAHIGRGRKDTRYDRPRQDWHLFGTGMQIGPTAMCQKKAGEEWNRMRQALRLGPEQTLYSLRDSGIVDMLHRGVDVLTVMQAAGHHDLSITSLYADHIDGSLIERVRQMQGEF